MHYLLADFLNAVAANDSPISLTYGDTDAEPLDAESLARIADAARDAGEPLYIRPLTTEGEAAFLYTVLDNAGPDHWRDLTVPPTAALFKDETLIAAFALHRSASTETVRALAEAMGADLADPIPTPGANGWELVHCDPEAVVSVETLAAVYCDEEQPAATYETHGAFQDAALLSPFDPGDPAYAGEMIVALGAHRESTNWRSEPMTTADFIGLITKHHESPHKDGPAFVMAEIAGARRTKLAVKAVYGVGLDFDVGTPGSKIIAGLREMGCLAVLYSTHSHNKATTAFRKDRLVRFADKVGATVDDNLIQRFLREEEGWDDAVVDTAAHAGEEHASEGVMTKVSHAPLPKYRVVVPLAAPFVISEAAKTQDEAMKLWTEVPKAVARLLGDLPLDKAALDPCRLFYFPRHAQGRPHEMFLLGGPLMDWRKLDLRSTDRNHFDATLAREFSSAGKGRSTTAEGQALGRWSVGSAAGFQVADVIRDHAEERIRTPGLAKIEIECPFDEHHSNAGDPEDRACFAVNAGDGPSDIFTVKCLHEACRDRTNLDMLGKMIADGWFGDEVLNEPGYNALAEVDDAADTSLAGAFPPPSAAHGSYAYRMFDERPWLHSVGEKGAAKRLYTPCVIEAGVVYADRDHQRGLRAKFLDENGDTQRIDVTAGMAVRGYGADLKVLLREKGVLMTEEGEGELVRLFKQVQPADPIAVYTRPGWQGAAFLTPWGTVVGANQPIELAADNQPPGLETAGTLSGWIEATKAVFESDVLHFQVGVLSAFVSPILDLCGYPSIWLAYSGSTSKGKSTSQRLQAAVWGDPAPKRGTFGNFNGTAAASEALLARASGAGFAFDEAHTLDGAELQKLIFKATGDGGADRLKRNADLRAARHWTLLVSLSNETSLHQKIKGAGAAVTTGLGARVLDINVEDAPSLDRDTMERIEAAFAHHGYAGCAFVRAMIAAGHPRQPERLRIEIEAKADLLAGPTAEPPVRRAARIAALIWQAGEIAQGAGLIPGEFDTEALARRLWGRAMEADTAPGSAETLAMNTLFETLIRRRGADIPEALGGSNREAVAWRSEDFKSHGAVYIVSIAALATLAGGALNHTAVARALATRGLLIPNERADKRSNIWDHVPGLGRVRAVVIPASAVEGED